MSNTMQGRRLPDRDQFKFNGFEPGDYCKLTDEDNETVWMCKPPRGALGGLSNHTITEHEDGTITVSPSIWQQSNDPQQEWHGWLEHGVWRSI